MLVSPVIEVALFFVPKILRAITPTICIYYTLVHPSLSQFPKFRESFGNGEYFLDLSFQTNPRGWLQSNWPSPITFKGAWVSVHGSHPIRGTVRPSDSGSQYVFRSPEGTFVGNLVPANVGCEPRMHYRIVQPERNEMGVMRAGFCL